jgi:hypothetical protein
MKVEQITRFSNDQMVKGVKCCAPHCGATIKLGDTAMYHRKSGFGYVALHVECVRAMISDVPTDESVMGQFNEIKGLATQGSAEWL